LHADNDLVVIDKPAGLLAVPGRDQAPSAIDLLRAMPPFSLDEPLRIVHRLDREASGVLVYARTLEAQRHLVAQFVSRQVEKVYYALVRGYVERDGEVDLPLLLNRRRGRVEPAPQHGKPALTRYTVLQRLPGHTWLECRPVTGRMHQIRAHLLAIGHPLAVDPLYGGSRAVMLSHYKPGYKLNRSGQERPLVDRLTLHAARIAFTHPQDGRKVAFEAPLPKDLRATLRQLSRLLPTP